MSDETQRGECQADDLNVICPYCKASYYAEAADYDEREREVTCDACERVFLLCDEMSVTHHTRPIESKPSK